MKRHIILIALSIAYSPALHGADCMAKMPAREPATGPQAREIIIANFTFEQETLTIPVGTTVTWTNEDDTVHRVQFTDLKALSKALDTDDLYSFTFDKPGVFHYFCPLHPQMTGSVIVTAMSGKTQP